MNRAPKSARQRRTGWHKKGMVGVAPIHELATPARWELLLRSLGLSEAAAAALVGDPLERKSVAGECIRQFARQWRRRAYVPEAVLMALGMTVAEVELEDGRGWRGFHGPRRGMGEA